MPIVCFMLNSQQGQLMYSNALLYVWSIGFQQKQPCSKKNALRKRVVILSKHLANSFALSCNNIFNFCSWIQWKMPCLHNDWRLHKLMKRRGRRKCPFQALYNMRYTDQSLSLRRSFFKFLLIFSINMYSRNSFRSSPKGSNDTPATYVSQK